MSRARRHKWREFRVLAVSDVDGVDLFSRWRESPSTASKFFLRLWDVLLCRPSLAGQRDSQLVQKQIKRLFGAARVVSRASCVNVAYLCWNPILLLHQQKIQARRARARRRFRPRLEEHNTTIRVKMKRNERKRNIGLD